LIAVLVEALYYLANQLEDISWSLVKVAASFFQRLMERVRKSSTIFIDCWAMIVGLSNSLRARETGKARFGECGSGRVRSLRAGRFYDEGTFSIIIQTNFAANLSRL